jgi:hypothetical protein
VNTAATSIKTTAGADDGTGAGFEVPDPHFIAYVICFPGCAAIGRYPNAHISSGGDTNGGVVENAYQLF